MAEGMSAEEFFCTYGEPIAAVRDKYDDREELTAFWQKASDNLGSDTFVA